MGICPPQLCGTHTQARAHTQACVCKWPCCKENQLKQLIILCVLDTTGHWSAECGRGSTVFTDHMMTKMQHTRKMLYVNVLRCTSTAGVYCTWKKWGENSRFLDNNPPPKKMPQLVGCSFWSSRTPRPNTHTHTFKHTHTSDESNSPSQTNQLTALIANANMQIYIN